MITTSAIVMCGACSKEIKGRIFPVNKQPYHRLCASELNKQKEAPQPVWKAGDKILWCRCRKGTTRRNLKGVVTRATLAGAFIKINRDGIEEETFVHNENLKLDKDGE